MIPESAILEWTNTVPWNSNEQVEQDLIICRALVAIFNDQYLASHLAFRGGTALHKLYLHPQSRFGRYRFGSNRNRAYQRFNRSVINTSIPWF